MRQGSIEFVSLEWDRFGEILDLAFSVLYEPFGVRWADEVARGADWMHPARGTLVAVARDDDGLLGSGWLLPAQGDAQRQVRQLTVRPEVRRQGVGRALMLALEARAAEEGASETWLNSRNTAYGFYQSLGYRFEGDEFISGLTGIPHRAARKALR